MIGRADSPPTDWSPVGEYIRWIGKPWRRVEKLWHTHSWRGKTDRTDVTYSLHIGIRRLGVGFTVEVVKADCLDYSDEEHQ